MKDAGIVIPALNEAASIGAVLDELINEGFTPEKIYVVDNCSTDNTSLEASKRHVSVLSCMAKGKGSAVRAGMMYLLKDGADKVFTLDADFTYPAGAVKVAYNLMRQLPKDVFVMERIPLDGAMPWPNKVANRLINEWANMVNPMMAGINDLCSGLWCFPRSVIAEILPQLSSTGFTIEAEYYCKINKLGYSVWGFPYQYRPRMGGQKKTKPLDALRIMKYIWDNRCA